MGQEHLQQGWAACAPGLAQSRAGSHICWEGAGTLGRLGAPLPRVLRAGEECPVGTREGRGTVLIWGQETFSCAGCI